MIEYHVHTQSEIPAQGSSAVAKAGFNLNNLAEAYGLKDLMDFMDSGVQAEQSNVNEFTTYITASLSPKGTNTLKFWEVSV